MFTRILAAVDDSTRAAQVMEAARALAERAGGSLLALRVRATTRANAGPTARDVDLAEETRTLRERGLAAHYLLHEGTPERQIIETAELQHATLIVMASRRVGPRMLPGRRMTARLAATAPAPVLVLPEATGDERPAPFMAEGAATLVALDGSTQAEQAIPYAVDLAHLLHGPLALVYVAAPILTPAEEAEAWAYVRGARRRLRAALARDLTIDAQVVTGAPVDQLLWAAEGRQAAVIALTARGKSGLESRHASHIALEALNRARIPLLVIPVRALGGVEHGQANDTMEAPQL